ncbi:MAG: HYExAFE family protein [Gemmataceae bacterium]|nr:HYExAFE family protein [Gemmataceae bacterium]
MDHSNPYEAAFEAYLRQRELCYVAVDEAKRASWGGATVKNLDFIVMGANGRPLLVDVKGRRFPGGPADRPRYVWENWSTQEDVDGLRHWTRLFGQESTALFVFLYQIQPQVTLAADSPDLWTWRGQPYLLRAVAVDDYLAQMKVRSPKWGTVCLPTAVFHKLARPFRWYTHEMPV